MADKKISQLNPASALSGVEVVPIVQGIQTVKTSLQSIRDLALTSYQIPAGGIVTDATTSRTLSLADNGKIIYFTSNSAITVTTAAGLGAAFSCMIIQGGTGQITFAQGSSTTLVSWGSLVKSAGQYAGVSVLCPVANTFYLFGQTV